MPATRPRASFEPIAPDFDLKALVESTPNFSYVDRISCDMIDQQGLPAFEKLILLHVVIGGKPLVVDGFEDRLDPWTFTPKWLRDNCGSKHEAARNLTSKENLPLTMAHYLRNMGMLTNQFFSKPDAYKEQKRQRVYLKDIDCPDVWRDKLKEHIPNILFYLNDSTGEYGGPGAQPETSGVHKLGKGVARAGDLMSSLPPDMRAANLMCYIGHEGTYTPAHREMCASLGHNIMVEASTTIPSTDDGKPEKPGSSIWFMTESKDRHTVSEYWLSVLGHDIEVENHFAQVVAWKKAPFSVYVVEQRPGDFILIPPLAPHQVWNRGTRTMKVAWNRTTVETLEMALEEALPRSRVVCRDEQYKNKAIIYYTLQKYAGLLASTLNQAEKLPVDAAQRLLSSPKIKQLSKDFRRLFNLYKQVLVSEMFSSDDTPKGIEYLPFDSNVTCAYCRGNIFNRFLTCPSCKDVLGHHSGGGEGDPYDVCMDCYAMGRSCACISGLKWAEQFRWKELAAKYDSWRKLILQLDGGNVTDKTPPSLLEAKKRLGRRTLAEVCKVELKKRPWKDVRKMGEDDDKDASNEEEDEIIVDDHGMVKKIQKKRSKAWLQNNSACHVCCHRHPNWKMARCTTCQRMWCYGTLFRGWDKMPITIMEDENWTCPHCLGICFAGACKRDGKMTPYEPKGTLLGHDTRKVADARSVEALVDFSVSNLNWLKDGGGVEAGKQLKRAGEEAQKAKELDLTAQGDDYEDGAVEFDEASPISPATPIDPAIRGQGVASNIEYGDDDVLAQRLALANKSMTGKLSSNVNGQARVTPDGYTPVSHAGYIPPIAANRYPQPDEQRGYSYPGYMQSTADEESNESNKQELRPFKRGMDDENDDGGEEDITMIKSRSKKPRLTAAGFRSSDLAVSHGTSSTLKGNKSEAQRQFEKEQERQAVERAKHEGRFIMLQAALKGKRRIVKLPIAADRLLQLAAKTALSAGGEADAEHESEEGAAQQLEQELEEEAETVLLKSDIAPKKIQNPKSYYQQRQKDGYVLSSSSKKALIPVEKDGSYGHRDRLKSKGPAAAVERTSKRRGGSNVEYEEIDVGSDEDEDGDHGWVSGGTKPATSQQRGVSGMTRDKRSLPNYLQSKSVDKGEDDFSHESLGGTSNGSSMTNTSRPSAGGKLPAMRPAASMSRRVGRPRKSTHGAADEFFTDVDSIVSPSQTQAARWSFTSINRPSSSSTPVLQSPARSSANKSLSSLAEKQQDHRTDVDEQNRLAKLQALETVVDSESIGKIVVAKSRGGRSIARSEKTDLATMAETLERDSDESDGVEEIPAM